MKIALLMTIVMTCTACSGLKQSPTPAVTKAVLDDILSKQSHKLRFENYGTRKVAFMSETDRKKEMAGWNADKAIYVLDGHHIGVGQTGWENLKHILKKLPKGSRLAIADYYGGGGFPFDEKTFNELCKQCGIEFGVPAL